MKTTIGMESSADLSAHSIGCADDELWLWGPQTNSYGQKQWGINEGRYGSAYSVRSFYTRKEAVAELRKMRRERAENEAIFELSHQFGLTAGEPLRADPGSRPGRSKLIDGEQLAVQPLPKL